MIGMRAKGFARIQHLLGQRVFKIAALTLALVLLINYNWLVGILIGLSILLGGLIFFEPRE